MTTPPERLGSRGRVRRRCEVASRRVAQRGSSRTVFREGNSCGPGDTTHRRSLRTADPARLFHPSRPPRTSCPRDLPPRPPAPRPANFQDHRDLLSETVVIVPGMSRSVGTERIASRSDQASGPPARTDRRLRSDGILRASCPGGIGAADGGSRDLAHRLHRRAHGSHQGPGRPGEVLVKIRGGTEAYIAWSPAPLPKGATVLVIESRGNRTVDVSEWTDPLNPFPDDPNVQ